MITNYSIANSRRLAASWRGCGVVAIVLGLVVQIGTIAQGATPAVPEGLSSADWTSIRGAYEANRHALVAKQNGFRAHNPGQQWRTEFDQRGFVIRPDAGGWQWGLELKSCGFPGQKREIAKTSAVKTEGDRIIYRRDAGLYEWMVNDERGLEHGFTLAHAPEGAREAGTEIEFDFAVRGNLHPELTAGGEALLFVDEHGLQKVTYEQLKAWDAEGKELCAHFVIKDNIVRLKLETAGASYPITIDPLAQQAYLKASNPDSLDNFGRSVAVSGDTVVVGAFFEDSGATGVNGDEADNSVEFAGAAYVFVREGATWVQQAYLKASNAGAYDFFGFSVAVSGDTVVVGAYPEDSGATGINGDGSDNSAASSGAAYVFVRTGTTWKQQAYLKASNADAGDLFGYTVAISGATVVVGANREESNATGVNGDGADNSALYAGAAYVFVREGLTWTQEAYLKASNTDAFDYFGGSVGVSGDTVIVGAGGETSNASGINGDQSDNSAFNAGAAYVFARNDTTWTQQVYLKASNTKANDSFGRSVAISGETAIVGADAEDSSATGVNGDQGDDSAENAGAAYIFSRTGDKWSQQAYLKASNTEAYDRFGASVAVSGNTVVVGAYEEDSVSIGTNGDQSNNSALGSGAAYVYKHDGISWAQESYLKASNTGVGDEFGHSVAVSEPTVVIGAYAEDSNAVGINGDQTDNSAANAGAAYIFNVPTTLRNLSARLRIEVGDNILIGGFIITGAEQKQVLVRAIGPSLPLSGVLADPVLELYDDGGVLIAGNDNWIASLDRQEIIDTTIPPPNVLESAILTALQPGLYTAIVRGANATTGVGLVEVYDLDETVNSELANISTRGFVRTGDEVMIGGFILLGPLPREVLVRAIGPSLSIGGKLTDPVLELYDSEGSLLGSNDNWRSDQEGDIIDTTIPPENDFESAIMATLPPNGYTAIVRGKDGSTGVALVEIYALSSDP